MTTPPVCNYEGSDYQTSFWAEGRREYEDRVEAIALRRLLPKGGRLLLELGAGAGRNTPRYQGFERIVLLDYSRTQLEQAQQRLGKSEKYIYVAADAYRLPFVDGLFDAATMIRALHHMADAPKALWQVRKVLQPGAAFVLEYANKLNLKAILRYLLRRQTWSPFALAPVEFAELNFDFHPRTVRGWLKGMGFSIERTLAVSHFRVSLVKRLIPMGVLVGLDSMMQWTGAFWQLTPSVFLRARVAGRTGGPTRELPQSRSDDQPNLRIAARTLWFKCPTCDHAPLIEKKGHLTCPQCRRKWALRDGIYDFREPMK